MHPEINSRETFDSRESQNAVSALPPVIAPMDLRLQKFHTVLLSKVLVAAAGVGHLKVVTDPFLLAVAALRARVSPH